MDRSDLDLSIDKVARGLTAGAPSAALRERVAARLSASNDRRGKPWFWIGGTLLAAGAAVVLMVITPIRWTEDQPALQLSAAVARPAPAPRTEEPRTQNPGTPEPRNPGTPEPRTLEPSSSLLAWESRAIPALIAPEPSAMPDIQPEPLEIRPLVTPALIVPALGEDEDR